MAFEVLFYQTAKERNSTKAAANSELKKTLQCTIVEPCDITKPTLKLVLATGENPRWWNWCAIPIFNYYYFVDGWTYDKGCWYARCNADLLGTYKNAIGNSTQYILRCSNKAGWDDLADDTMFPERLAYTEKTAVALDYSPKINSFPGGTYLVSIASGDASAIGCSALYALSPLGMQGLRSKLLVQNPTYLGDVGETITNGLLKTIFNPMQYITGCYWVPIATSNFSSYGDQISELPVGWWYIPVSGIRLTQANMFVRCNFIIEQHPSASTRGRYLNSYPHTRLTVQSPLLGSFDLDPGLINLAAPGSTTTNLSFVGLLDFSTGKLTYYFTGKQSFIYGGVAQYGTPMSLAANTVNFVGSAISLAGGILGAVTTGNPLAAASGVTNGINNMLPAPTRQGTTGDVTSSSLEPQILCKYSTLTGAGYDKLGYPCLQHKQVYTLPGYIKTNNAHLDISGCTGEHIDQICAMMDGGFYYE